MSEPVFDPERDGISDAEWSELVQQASAGGSHFFTENQLYLAYARNKVEITRFIAARGVVGLGMVVLGLAAWVHALRADWGLTLVLGIIVTLSGVALVGTGVVTRRDPASREPVKRWLARWLERQGCERLIRAPTLADGEPEYAPAHARCLIIVEREAVVDLLLKNGAALELSALIVAESGYPSALATEAQRLLALRPELKVILLHDATPEGVAMATRIQQSPVYPVSGRALTDAGLFPADVIWLAELAPAIPAGHTQRVPVDSLSYAALLLGLRGVLEGALSLHAAIGDAHEPPA